MSAATMPNGIRVDSAYVVDVFGTGTQEDGTDIKIAFRDGSTIAVDRVEAGAATLDAVQSRFKAVRRLLGWRE